MTASQAITFVFANVAVSSLIGLVSSRISANLYRWTKRNTDTITLIGIAVPAMVTLMFWSIALLGDYRYENIERGLAHMGFLGAFALIVGCSVAATVNVVSLAKALYEGICARIDRMF